MMKSDSDSNIKSNLAEKYWEFSGEKVPRSIEMRDRERGPLI